MKNGLFITATGTDVGKTVFAAGLTWLLRSQGIDAVYYKPILSGAVRKGNNLIPSDVEFVKKISGLTLPHDQMSTFIFERAVSPHLAARKTGTIIKIELILDQLRTLQKQYEFVIMEGCGGLSVPLNDNGLMLHHLIKKTGFSCVIVAPADVGTINHCTLTAAFAKQTHTRMKGFVFNNFTGKDFEVDNASMVSKLTGLPILATIPCIKGLHASNPQPSLIHKVFKKHVHPDLFLGTSKKK